MTTIADTMRTGMLTAPSLLGDPRLRRVLDLLNPAGEETRIVGGAVRNALLGLGPGDIDLATTMRPETVIAHAKAARLRAIPTGIEHGTVTLMVEALPVEVTTLREDVETDGRHAVVRFGRDFALDAQRRDFTINALSAAADGRLFDTVGGADDLAAGRVRFIGDAQTRIREDYLRILRFFRFHATYGRGAPDADGLAAATRNKAGLDRLSRERVQSELFKILGAPGVTLALGTMAEAGILDSLVGPGADPHGVAAMLQLGAGEADPVLRLAALAIRDQADAERLREGLRLSNAQSARLKAALAAQSGLARLPDAAGLRTLLFLHGPQPAADALRLAFAAGLPPRAVEPWDLALADLAETLPPVLPLTGADLLMRGLRGPEIGMALATLRAEWAAAACPDEPAVLAAMLDRAVDRHRGPS